MSNPKTVLALDPGLTTGHCLLWRGSFDIKPPSVKGVEIGLHGQFPPEETWFWLSLYNPGRLVVENFTFQQRTKVDYTPLKVIGRIEEWAQQHGIAITFQIKSHVDHYFTDDRLKEYGLYFPGERHATDAARHLCYFLKFGEGKDIGTDLSRLRPKAS